MAILFRVSGNREGICQWIAAVYDDHIDVRVGSGSSFGCCQVIPEIPDDSHNLGVRFHISGDRSQVFSFFVSVQADHDILVCGVAERQSEPVKPGLDRVGNYPPCGPISGMQEKLTERLGFRVSVGQFEMHAGFCEDVTGHTVGKIGSGLQHG